LVFVLYGVRIGWEPGMIDDPSLFAQIWVATKTQPSGELRVAMPPGSCRRVRKKALT